MPEYRWNSPYDWLSERIDEAARKADSAELASLCRSLLGKLDNDTIQDEFQGDMDRDGYFRPRRP